jgi:hypothetical protein
VPDFEVVASIQHLIQLHLQAWKLLELHQRQQ